MSEFHNRVVTVTGASSGIGISTARTLLSHGARVGMTDLHLSAEVDKLCSEYGDRAFFAQGDVSQEESVRQAHATLTDALGHPDGLVCCAGVMSGKTFRDTPIELWRKTFAVNVEGAVLWMQAVLGEMVANKYGSVILFSSQLTKSGGQNNAAYITAKGALGTLTRTVALEHAADNIRVNAIVPGAIDTPMLRNGSLRFPDPEAALNRSRARHPLGRFGTADEIAACVAFLLSESSAFMTGAELVVDGGWSIG